jgi:hypothetical protein
MVLQPLRAHAANETMERKATRGRNMAFPLREAHGDSQPNVTQNTHFGPLARKRPAIPRVRATSKPKEKKPAGIYPGGLS